MTRNPISVTGMGIICAIGCDASSVLDSLRKKESGIRRMKYLQTVHRDLPVGEVQLSDDQMKEMLGLDCSRVLSRTAMMGAIAIRQAISQAGPSALDGKRVTLISGTTVGNLDVTEKYFRAMKTDDSLLSLPHSNECGESTLDMARMAGLPENIQVCTISTACSSALNSIILGSEMLKNDETDIVIAGGTEGLSKFHLNGFNTLMILDKERCRPFDESRAGLNLGEGAAFVVLQKNVPNALAYVSGYGNRCDAFHQTASSDNGEGAFLAMGEALRMSGLKPADIAYVNAHGTGTASNDRSESQALIRVFGQDMPEVSSTKAFTGHTTSASGSIETVISILAMREGFTPANLGWSTQSEGGIIPTPGHEDVVMNHVMCNSFGFGGNDSSLILSKEAAVSENDRAEKCRYSTIVDVALASTDELAGLKEFVSPMESRRMGKLMRAAMLCALRALKEAGLQTTDAIIAATSRGMLQISQEFLDDIDNNGEELLKPTLFMQSTHNTIGSAIAIRTGCHGYNTTYSQREDSLDWALRDARRQLSTGQAGSVMVISFDESSGTFDSFTRRSGGKVPAELHARCLILKREQ